MSGDFYLEDSDEFYKSFAWEGERKVLESQGAIALSVDQANRLNVDEFFSRTMGSMKPILSKRFDYFALPYELDDGLLLEGQKGNVCIDVVVGMIGEYLSNPYIASTDRSKCCVVRSNNLNAEVIWSLFSGHLNTPFIVFDEARSTLVLIDFDLPLQILGYKGKSVPETMAFLWRGHFAEMWPKVVRKYRHYEGLPNIVDDYYSFILDNGPRSPFGDSLP